MKSRKLPVVWVVVVRCNLDDVIAGSFSAIASARRRKRDILDGKAEPDATSARSRMVAWDNSGLIAVAIYRCQGTKVEHWEQDDFDNKKKVA